MWHATRTICVQLFISCSYPCLIRFTAHLRHTMWVQVEIFIPCPGVHLPLWLSIHKRIELRALSISVAFKLYLSAVARKMRPISAQGTLKVAKSEVHCVWVSSTAWTLRIVCKVTVVFISIDSSQLKCTGLVPAEGTLQSRRLLILQYESPMNVDCFLGFSVREVSCTW